MRKTMLGFASLALMLGATPAWVGAADPDAATAEGVIAKVHEAAKYLHDKGQAAFPDFNNNARWVWKDSYVFVYSLDLFSIPLTCGATSSSSSAGPSATRSGRR